MRLCSVVLVVAPTGFVSLTSQQTPACPSSHRCAFNYSLLVALSPPDNYIPSAHSRSVAVISPDIYLRASLAC